jgi:translation initiation factor 2 subunit 1
MVKIKGLPNIHELVVVKITEVTQFAAWCDLLEYDAKGIIPISEAAGKWIFDVHEIVKEGEVRVAKVIKVEEDKKLVHLSLKRVSKADEKEKINDFKKEERGEKLLEMAAKSLRKNLQQAYEEVGYLLKEKFGSLYDAIVNIKKNYSRLEKLKVPKEWLDAISEIVEKSIREKEVELNFELEIKSLEPNGIEIIKSILKEVKEKTGGDIRYISAPNYRLEIKTTNPKKDEKKVLTILERIKSKYKEFSFRRVE